MAYSDFTLDEVVRRFGLTLAGGVDQFHDLPEADLPPGLAALLERNLPLAIQLSNERARSELLISPVLVELKFRHPDRLGLFVEVDFSVDAEAGLAGRADYILTRNPQQLLLAAPVCVIVEAKKDDIAAGLPQCLAEMVAAQRFNEAGGTVVTPVYGAVTTGELWRFLSLDGTAARVDRVQYNIQSPRKIFGILTRMALGE